MVGADAELEPPPEVRVYAVIAAIPAGRVLSYGEVAALSGLPRRARWVGRVLSNLPAGSRLPWHRVVRADGRLAQREGQGQQQQRLQDEGVAVQDRRLNLARYRWHPGQSHE